MAGDVTRRSGAAEVAGYLSLTQTEPRVLHLLATHLSLVEIGRELGVSRNTVKTHVAAIYPKFRATTRASAVQQGHQLGFLTS